MESSKNFAFGIVTLSITGGLQRDCIIIAQRLMSLGHTVAIYCARQDGALPPELSVRVLPSEYRTNHGRNLGFSERFRAEVSGKYDCVVGFDKLAGLDVHYCGDWPSTPVLPFLKYMPRYQGFKFLERQCFAPDGRTLNLLLSDRQAAAYQRIWQTPHQRIVLVPPNLQIERRKPELRPNRNVIRQSLGYQNGDWVWLGMATQPHTKGVDRTLRAMTKFPSAKLMLVGAHGASTSARRCAQLVNRLDLSRRVQWLGHREDIPEVMAAADILVHPPRVDTTGKIILEAVVNGLPAIATDVCGYSRHVVNASAGIVLPEPFSVAYFHQAIAASRDETSRNNWSAGGMKYGVERKDLYTGFDRALENILRQAGKQDADCSARPN